MRLIGKNREIFGEIVVRSEIDGGGWRMVAIEIDG